MMVEGGEPILAETLIIATEQAPSYSDCRRKKN